MIRKIAFLILAASLTAQTPQTQKRKPKPPTEPPPSQQLPALPPAPVPPITVQVAPQEIERLNDLEGENARLQQAISLLRQQLLSAPCPQK